MLAANAIFSQTTKRAVEGGSRERRGGPLKYMTGLVVQRSLSLLCFSVLTLFKNYIPRDSEKYELALVGSKRLGIVVLLFDSTT